MITKTLTCKFCGEMPMRKEVRSLMLKKNQVVYECSCRFGCVRPADGATQALKYWNEENEQ